jgi:hypothetical protein
MPNPEGKDTGNEKIILQNLSKKTVRLKNWKIATQSITTTTPKKKASKKKRTAFVNHPIITKIILKPKQTVTLTALDSRFTLNNTASKVALRTPDNKIIQTIHYAAPEKTAKDDDRYVRLTSRQWAWIPGTPTPKATTELATNDSPSTKEALVNETLATTQEPMPARGSHSQKEKSLAALPLQPTVLGTYTISQTSPPALDSLPSEASEHTLTLVLEAINAWIQNIF